MDRDGQPLFHIQNTPRSTSAFPFIARYLTVQNDETSPLLNGDALDTKTINLAPKPASYSSFVAYAFIINYVVGVGILGMPYAFVKAGILMSIGFLIFITFITIVAAIWIIEVSARAFAIDEADNAHTRTNVTVAGSVKGINNSIDINSDEIIIEHSDTDLTDEPLTETEDEPDNSAPHFYISSLKKFELNELCRMFLGRYGKLFYEGCLILYMLGTLWSFTAVFASSMTAHVPIPHLSLHHDCDIYEKDVHWSNECEYTYLLYVGLYVLLVIPLSLMDLTDQVVIQVALMLLRWIGLGIMSVTVAIAIGGEAYLNDPKVSGPPYLKYKTLADISGFGIIFTTAVFSQLIQHSTPGLIQPVRNKASLSWVFAAALGSTCILYIIAGTLCAIYFGDEAKQLVSLNWTDYNGYFSSSHTPIWADIISYIVVLFPAVTVTSAFPLLAITLGNNLFFGMPAWLTNNYQSKWMKFGFRLLAAIPPIICGSILKKLAIIIEIAGMSGFFVGFIVPGILQIAARRECVRRWGQAGDKNLYTLPLGLSHWSYVGAIVVFGVGALIYTIVDLIISGGN